METVAKPQAAEWAMARGAALGDLFPAPLEFRRVSAGPCEPLGQQEEATNSYAMYASFVAKISPREIGPALESLHAHWFAHGWDSSLRRFNDGGGEVRANDPEHGFGYTVEDQDSGDGLVLRVVTPCYHDPEPHQVFTGVHPT